MIGIRLSSAIRLHYLRQLFGQSIHVLDSMPPGYATTTITSTSDTLQLGISEKLGVFVEYTSTIVAAIVIAFVYSWSLTLVTSSAVLFILLTVCILLPFIVRSHGRVSKVGDARTSCIRTFNRLLTTLSCSPRPSPLPWRARPCLAFEWSWHAAQRLALPASMPSLSKRPRSTRS